MSEATDRRSHNGRWKVENLDSILQTPTARLIIEEDSLRRVEYDEESPEKIASRIRELSQSMPALGLRPIVPAAVRWIRRMTYRDTDTGLPEPDDRIVALVELYKDGQHTQRKLAQTARVSKSTMDRVLNGSARLPFEAADVHEIQQHSST